MGPKIQLPHYLCVLARVLGSLEKQNQQRECVCVCLEKEGEREV